MTAAEYFVVRLYILALEPQFQNPGNDFVGGRNSIGVGRPFRGIVEWRGQPTQEVVVVGPDGAVVLALYPMQLQPDGRWLINGCTLMALPDESA